MSSQLIDGVVIPYPDGKKEHNTRSWRDATDLELEQAARIEELEKREWVDLTDEELYAIDGVEMKYDGTGDYYLEGEYEFARAIEAKLKEKNT